MLERSTQRARRMRAVPSFANIVVKGARPCQGKPELWYPCCETCTLGQTSRLCGWPFGFGDSECFPGAGRWKGASRGDRAGADPSGSGGSARIPADAAANRRIPLNGATERGPDTSDALSAALKGAKHARQGKGK